MLRVTANFERNLESIRSFLEEEDPPREFGALLDQLFDSIIPNLERFPQLGVDFMARVGDSVETRELHDRLSRRLKPSEEMREYITEEYIVLYLLRGAEILLLAIKHHRQLSLDLTKFY